MTQIAAMISGEEFKTILTREKRKYESNSVR